MSLVSLILDSRPGYLDGASPSTSLLTLPLGPTTPLRELADCLSEFVADHWVLPSFRTTPQYAKTISAASGQSARVVTFADVSDLVHGSEPSDLLLIIDPRYWPVDGPIVESILQRNAPDMRWAIHGVAVTSPREGTREYVHCDDEGRVRRIGRYYERVTCTRIDAIAYALVPLASLDGIQFRSLPELRSALAARGMLSRDVPVGSTVVDLNYETGLLTINEQRAVAAVRDAETPGYTAERPGLLVGKRCRIHPSARIVGPVVVHDHVTVEEGASLVGPTVIGAESVVRRGALIAQSVLTQGASVAPKTIIRQRISAGVSKAGESSTADLHPVNSEGIRLGADASAMRSVRPRRTIYPTIKHTVDAVVSLIALVVVSPVLLVVAIAVKLESSGPIFFGHEREGRDGKVFRCLKFRTMRKDAHRRQRELYAGNTLDGPQFKLHNDPRVTRVGWWLRKTNLDELPQFINVLLGQMSIVGPRPSPFRENQICVPWRKARLSVRPGITGLWQICRDQRSEGDFHQWIAYDIMYVRNLSAMLDLKILAATVLTLGGMWHIPHSWLLQGEPSPARRKRDGVRQSVGRSDALGARSEAVISG